MGRTFDEWWLSVPKEIRDKIRNDNNLMSKKPDILKIGPVIDSLRTIGEVKLVPQQDEIITWVKAKNLLQFNASQLRELSPSVTNILLKNQNMISDLLK